MSVASCHAAVPKRRTKGEKCRREKEGEEEDKGRSEKSLSGLRRIPCAVGGNGSGVLIRARVRRYEIIKLGLDGGEGDGMARGLKKE